MYEHDANSGHLTEDKLFLRYRGVEGLSFEMPEGMSKQVMPEAFTSAPALLGVGKKRKTLSTLFVLVEKKACYITNFDCF